MINMDMMKNKIELYPPDTSFHIDDYKFKTISTGYLEVQKAILEEILEESE